MLRIMDYQKALWIIRTRLIVLNCASTLAWTRHVCPISALGIHSSLILPSYLKLLTVPSHGYVSESATKVTLRKTLTDFNKSFTIVAVQVASINYACCWNCLTLVTETDIGSPPDAPSHKYSHQITSSSSSGNRKFRRWHKSSNHVIYNPGKEASSHKNAIMLEHPAQILILLWDSGQFLMCQSSCLWVIRQRGPPRPYPTHGFCNVGPGNTALPVHQPFNAQDHRKLSSWGYHKGPSFPEVPHTHRSRFSIKVTGLI